jgi:hypothetical protein
MHTKINNAASVLNFLTRPVGVVLAMVSFWLLLAAPTVHAAQCYADGTVADCSTFSANAFDTIPGGLQEEGCYRLGQVTSGPIGGEQVRQFTPESCDSALFGGQLPEGTPPNTTPTPTGSPTQNRTPEVVESDCQGDNIRAGAAEGTEEHCGILDYLVLFINVLSGLVGIAVVGSIIYGGIQYGSAGSDPQKVSAAKDRIRNAIIALLFFIFMYGFLNYLIPGGVIR